MTAVRAIGYLPCMSPEQSDLMSGPRAGVTLETVASHWVQTFTRLHASEETRDFRLCRKLGNGLA
jgi:hypothetical protein